MKSRTILCLGAGALLTLSSCYTWRPPGPPPPPRRGASLDAPPHESTRFMGGPDLGPVPSDGPIPGEVQTPQQQASTPPPDAPPTITDPEPTPAPPTVQPKPPGPNQDLPYGIKVPGKPGMVYSPYNRAAGYVDCRDERDVPYPTGKKVTCPYTGKVFLVP